MENARYVDYRRSAYFPGIQEGNGANAPKSNGLWRDLGKSAILRRSSYRPPVLKEKDKPNDIHFHCNRRNYSCCFNPEHNR